MSYVLALCFVVLSIAAIIFLTSRVKLNSFITLFIVSLFLALFTVPPHIIIEQMQLGFGKTMGSVGFLIILGAIIGITLDKTGAMISIANFILKKVGKHNSAAAIGITGFVVGVPIFCDSGFIIMSSLAKSFSAKSKTPMVFIATVLATSLYSVHCLIPTHPGALAGAEIINANIGHLIIAGLIFALPGAVIAFLWSKFLSKSPESNFSEFQDLEQNHTLQKAQLPSVFLSLIPIIVPLMLIMISSFLKVVASVNDSLFTRMFIIVGQPVFALFVGAILSLLLLKDRKVATLNKIYSEAIEKAGPILIIIAAGGMFGMIITATGIGQKTGRILSDTGLGLWVPFLIALFLKTAQGSSTVATITAASLVAPMISFLGLNSETGRILAMLSIGAGSMVFSHANDAYFWVVSRFSDLDVSTTLKVYSSATVIMGFVIFAFVLIVSFFLL